MASKSKPVNQTKCRKLGLISGPLRATQSFGLTPKKVAEPVRQQTSGICGSENIKLVAGCHQSDAKATRRSSSPDSPGVLRRGRRCCLSFGIVPSQVNLRSLSLLIDIQLLYSKVNGDIKCTMKLACTACWLMIIMHMYSVLRITCISATSHIGPDHIGHRRYPYQPQTLSVESTSAASVRQATSCMSVTFVC